jgi:hypothetical protein
MLLDVGCFIVSVYGAVNPLSLSRTRVSTALTLTPFYLFALLGLPCSILLVHGAWYAERSEKAGGSSSHLTSERKGNAAVVGSGRGTRGSRRGGDLSTNSPMVTIVVDVHVDEDTEGNEKYPYV